MKLTLHRDGTISYTSTSEGSKKHATLISESLFLYLSESDKRALKRHFQRYDWQCRNDRYDTSWTHPMEQRK